MTDLVINMSNVVTGAPANLAYGFGGETFQQGHVVYLKSTDQKYYLADSNHADPEGRIPAGIALNRGNANQPITIQRAGEISIGATLVAGTDYYLSDTPGGICPRADVGSGENVAFLGLAKTTGILTLDIQAPGVTL